MPVHISNLNHQTLQTTVVKITHLSNVPRTILFLTSNIAGIDSPRCETCLLVLEDIAECETHMAKKHGKNPFKKYGLFRQQIAEQAKAAIQERRNRKFQECALKNEMLMMKPGKYCRICKAKFPEDQFSAHWASHKVHDPTTSSVASFSHAICILEACLRRMWT